MSLENQPTMIRGKHDREHPYVMISKEMLRDQSISPKAKGFLCYLLSLPDNWKTNPCQVAEALGVGEDTVYSSLTELIESGYAKRSRERNDKGHWTPFKYEFFEERLPHRGFPDVDDPHVEKPDHTKDIKTKKTENTEKPPPPKASSSEIAPPSSAGGGGGLSLSSSIVGDWTYRNVKGEALSKTQTQIFRHFLNLSFPTEIVKEAIKQASESTERIGDPWRYLEAICFRLTQEDKAKIEKPEEQERPSKNTQPKVSLLDAFNKLKQKGKEKDV